MNRKPTRRSFFGQAGAALAAPFAATAAFAGEIKGKTFVVGSRAAFDDANAIRVLQHRYARFVSTANRAALAASFDDPAHVAVDQRVQSVVVDGDDKIEISTDGTATARVPCTVTTATPIESCGTLVEMARAQGEGFVTRTDRRVLRGTFVKRDGVWKIATMELEA